MWSAHLKVAVRCRLLAAALWQTVDVSNTDVQPFVHVMS